MLVFHIFLPGYVIEATLCDTYLRLFDNHYSSQCLLFPDINLYHESSSVGYAHEIMLFICRNRERMKLHFRLNGKRRALEVCLLKGYVFTSWAKPTLHCLIR